VSTRPSDEASSWLISPAESMTGGVGSRASLLRWVTCGDRADYAAVAFDPVLRPETWGVSSPVADAVLAPRHAGFSLTTGPFPLDAFVATVGRDISEPSVIEPSDLKIRIWVVVSPDDSL
jgi:hypothetical protein